MRMLDCGAMSGWMDEMVSGEVSWRSSLVTSDECFKVTALRFLGDLRINQSLSRSSLCVAMDRVCWGPYIPNPNR